LPVLCPLAAGSREPCQLGRRSASMDAITLPRPIQRRIEAAASDFLRPKGLPSIDFSSPPGEPALVEPHSVSWRVFKNPIALFIGGVTAVILELAEPRVRAGVWNHTSFRTDPIDRLQRTGLAAMVTVYSARSTAEAMIAGVRRKHAKVTGRSEDGESYSASDPELLNWVEATAAYDFLEAYHCFVHPLPRRARDRFYAEALPAAHLYGAINAPANEAEWRALFAAMLPRLQASPIILEFLEIMRCAPALPAGGRPLQALLIRTAVGLLPDEARARLRLYHEKGLSFWQAALVRTLAQAADRLVIETAPPAQASMRMGLPAAGFTSLAVQIPIVLLERFAYYCGISDGLFAKVSWCLLRLLQAAVGWRSVAAEGRVARPLKSTKDRIP
jgi:uncharacterized protein (DUF2236 family)